MKALVTALSKWYTILVEQSRGQVWSLSHQHFTPASAVTLAIIMHVTPVQQILLIKLIKHQSVVYINAHIIHVSNGILKWASPDTQKP